MFIMFVVFIASLLAGFHYQPDDDVLQPLPGNGIVITAPGALYLKSPTNEEAKKEKYPLSVVMWLEAHGEEIPGFGVIPYLQLPPPKKDTTRVLIIFGYNIDAIDVGSTFDAQFDLPDGATLVACKSMPGLTCEPADSSIPEGQGRSKKVVKISGTTIATSDTTAKTTGYLVQADISGIPGMIFTQSHTKTLVRSPTVVLTPFSPNNPPSASTEIPPLYIAAGVQFKNASTISWAETPSGSTSPGGVDAPVTVNGKIDDSLVGNRAMWAYPMFNSLPVTQPSIGGTDDEAVERSSNTLFIAGIWFGIAGGCFVTGLQQIIVGWPTRRGWGEFWRGVRRR